MAFIAQMSAVANRPLVFNCNKSAIILNPFLKLLKFNYMIKNSGVVYLTEKKLIDSINAAFFFIATADNFFSYKSIYFIMMVLF